MVDLANWLKSEAAPLSQAERRLGNRFLSYWEELRGYRPYPLISDISLEDMREFAPYIFNIELSPDGGDATVRFIGTEIEAACGPEVLNKTLGELPSGGMLGRALRVLGEVTTSGQPVFTSDEYLDEAGDAVLFRAVLLPFSNDGEAVTHVFGAMNRKVIAGPAEPRPAPENPVPAPEARREVAEILEDLESAMAGVWDDEETPTPLIGQRGHVIVLGNAKGGTGKTTAAMHLITGLLYSGKTVASIDFDAPQRSLSRYVENREAFNRVRELELPVSWHMAPTLSAFEAGDIEEDVAALIEAYDYVVIDTPGTDNAISRLAHSWADTLITPINDSFIDLDSLAVVEPGDRAYKKRGPYAELVLEAQHQRLSQTGRTPDWIVLRNRLSPLGARNKDRMSDSLDALSERLGFIKAPGLSERVVYRELFLAGLTLLDLREDIIGMELAMSHVAARNELRSLIDLVLETAAKAATAP